MRKAEALLSGMLIAAGCSEPQGPDSLGSHRAPGMIMTGPARVSDTIQAVIQDPIIVQVTRADGSPSANAIVQFFSEEQGAPVFRTLEDAAAYQWWNGQATADADGRVTVFVRLGTVAGSHRVWAVAGEYADTIVFQVNPGAPTGTYAGPADTAVVIGDSYPLSIRAADRHGNPRTEVPEDITVSSADGPVAQAQGPIVSALSIGRARVNVSSRFGTTQIHLSVVPHAMLAMVDSGLVLAATAGTSSIRVMNGDVSCPRWHPDGERLLLGGLRIVMVQGALSHIATGNPNLIPGCGEFSSDGELIYFDGRLATESDDAVQVWRIRMDGTGLEKIIAPAAGGRASKASPSPDGGRIAYLLSDSTDRLVVHTLATGAEDTIDSGFAQYGLWSPNGEWIATIMGSCMEIWLIRPKELACSTEVGVSRPDGSEGRLISGPDGGLAHSFMSGAVWSPDGEWLIGKAFYPDRRIMLVNFATGEALPLNMNTREYSVALWKPGPFMEP
jgi:WD40 repeat protein